MIIATTGSASLIEKRGWNLILSVSIGILIGLDDPDSWRRARWTIASTTKMSGRMKWIEKNRFRVGFPTENPPHSHSTITFPIAGIAEIKLVITVAAQNDIWAHGKTYPRNEVAIRIPRIVTPEYQVCLILNELNIRPRQM